MTSYQIALIPGDGVGSEITEEASRVLEAAAEIHGFDVATELFDWSCDRYLETGEMMPADALETLSSFDSIFLGCIGDANKVEDVKSPITALPWIVHPTEIHRKHDVFKYRQHWQKLKELEDYPQIATAPLRYVSFT